MFTLCSKMRKNKSTLRKDILMQKFSLKLMSAVIIIIMMLSVLVVAPVNAADTQSLYVTQVNQPVATASGALFTKAFNGTNKVKADATAGGNFIWAAVIAAEPTATKGVFKVTFSQLFFTDPNQEVTLPEGGFIYAAHCDDSDKESDVYKKSNANITATAALQVGQTVTISGIDIAAGTATATAAITIGGTSTGNSQATSSATSSSASSAVASSATSSAASSQVSSAASSRASSAPSAATSTPKSTSSANLTSSESKTDGISTGAVIGIAAGAIILIAAVSYILTKKKK
jgi:hypothetical protein